MKDFSPHAILRHPSIPDEAVERLLKMLLNSTSFKDKGSVVLILDPDLSPTPRDGRSSPAPWLRKTKTQK